MEYQKLSSTDAFIVFDLDEAPAVGITRLARKILRDGAELLARSTTYSFASFGIRMGGASAGINAEGDDVDPSVASFVDETRELVARGRWATDPGLGLTEENLSLLRIDDRRPPALWSDGLAEHMTALGAIAAAGAAVGGGLDGSRVSVAGSGAVVEAARLGLDHAGITVAGDAVDTECDVLFVAGKSGAVDHDVAATVRAGTVVPLTPVPITARAHAVLARAGRTHVPDFLAIAAPLLHAHDAEGDDPISRVTASVTELAGEGSGLWMAAVERAEEFLATWRDELPFGRPLA